MTKINQTIYKLSVILNIIFIVGILLIAYNYRSKIFDKVASFKSYNIVMLGNSFTSRGNWNYDLERTDIKNSGKGGSTTSHYVGYLKNAVIKHKPKICFIEGGTNDIGVGIPLNRTFKNYESIVDTLIKYKIEPVLQSTFYVNQPGDSIVNSKIDSLNVFLKNLAEVKSIIFLNLNSFLSENKRLKNEYSKDGVHINENAYKIWMNEIKKILALKKI